ncbi:MAG: sigma 54-interacting transcriptional regulator [Candidatus Poribacteria bacterium]|nr:sigma 54-interacting transcriptional regulator [Candidatus Poribacteria bacterium]
MDKPRILWIDDVYGKARNGRNRHRDTLCSRLGLQDVTGDCLPRNEQEPKPLLVIDDREIDDIDPTENDKDEGVADVTFCRGQVEMSGEVRNDLDGTLEMVRNGWEHPPRWSLLLLDMHFATGAIGADGEPIGKDEDWEPERYFGLTILDSLCRDSELRDIPVVITSAMERDVIERRFTTQGVWAFVDKIDLDKTKLEELLDDYGLLSDDKIIGHSLPLLQCLREARRRARIPSDNILILGESGTEKKLLAEYIHQKSGGKGDYCSFSESLKGTLEDELFDAAVLADEGTLFIDKFGDIIATAQPKLLQLLKNIHNRNLRVITAIERKEILYEDNFRKAFPDGALIHNFIRIPTLSQRSEDIPQLVKYFVKKYEEEFKAETHQVSEEALEALKAYPWPDNVSELENVIKDAVETYKELRWLEKDHLQSLSRGTHSPPIPSNQPNSYDLFKIIVKDDLWEQSRKAIGEMAIWLQDMAIWVLTEKALRGAIATILSGQFDSDWINHVSQKRPDIFKKWQNRQKDYSKMDFPGEKSDLPDLINFSSPSDLFKIILHDTLWNHFRTFFGTDAMFDNRWFEYWRVRERLIVHRVRHLMNHSNPDLIPSHDRDTFKGYCGEILEICQKIETVSSERGQQLENELHLPNAMDQEGTEQEAGEQEELYEGTVWAIMPNGDAANVEIDEHSTLQLPQFVKVPKDNFQDKENAFKGRKKVKFKVDKKRQGCPVYDVFLVE